jgi:hypothetical protein
VSRSLSMGWEEEVSMEESMEESRAVVVREVQ